MELNLPFLKLSLSFADTGIFTGWQSSTNFIGRMGWRQSCVCTGVSDPSTQGPCQQCKLSCAFTPKFTWHRRQWSSRYFMVSHHAQPQFLRTEALLVKIPLVTSGWLLEVGSPKLAYNEGGGCSLASFPWVLGGLVLALTATMHMGKSSCFYLQGTELTVHI